MPYSSASGVAKYCRNTLGPDTVFTQSSCPTLKQVKSWQSSGCSVIETHLVARGYEMPVASTSRAYDWVVNLEEVWAAAHAEFYRTNPTFSPEEKSRADVLTNMFWNQLDRLSKMDLSRLGVGRSSTGKIYIGGVSVSEKQTIENNSDLLKPRFFRGVGRFDETIQPTPSTASES